MANALSRPLSPHLGIWRWRVHMLVSILHRITGNALAFAGSLILVWWLVATMEGSDAYATFMAAARSWIGIVVLVGISWSYFQHLLSGLRHLAMDAGVGYEIGVSKATATLTLAGSLLLTAALWAIVLFR